MVTSGSSNESDSALEVLEDLVDVHPKEVERFSVLIKVCLYIHFIIACWFIIPSTC